MNYHYSRDETCTIRGRIIVSYVVLSEMSDVSSEIRNSEAETTFFLSFSTRTS